MVYVHNNNRIIFWKNLKTFSIIYDVEVEIGQIWQLKTKSVFKKQFEYIDSSLKPTREAFWELQIPP